LTAPDSSGYSRPTFFDVSAMLGISIVHAASPVGTLRLANHALVMTRGERAMPAVRAVRETNA